MLKPVLNETDEQRMLRIEDYINTPHIKEVFIKAMNQDIRGVKDHGKLIHASVVWNPYNIVYGPGYNTKGRSHRGYEPGSKLDTDILALQKDEFKQSSAINKALNDPSSLLLRDFSSLPRSQPVNWYRYDDKSKGGKLTGKYYTNQTQ